MNEEPRRTLGELIANPQYGRSLCDNPQRCEGLLRDFCGEYRKEIAALVGAVKEGVPKELLSSQHSVPSEVALARLTKRLQDDLALAEDAARWSVESWALALGVISSPTLPPKPIPPTAPPPPIAAPPIQAVSPPTAPPPPIAAPPTQAVSPPTASTKAVITGSVIGVFILGGILLNDYLSHNYLSIPRDSNATSLLFAGKMVVVTVAICFTPTLAYWLTQQRGRVVRVVVETLMFVILLLLSALWLFGKSTFGIWIGYASALIFLIEAGSNFVEWYRISTLKRLSRSILFCLQIILLTSSFILLL
jgi:hypothetical protein